jgi:hypothetical protein
MLMKDKNLLFIVINKLNLMIEFLLFMKTKMTPKKENYLQF